MRLIRILPNHYQHCIGEAPITVAPVQGADLNPVSDVARVAHIGDAYRIASEEFWASGDTWTAGCSFAEVETTP